MFSNEMFPQPELRSNPVWRHRKVLAQRVLLPLTIGFITTAAVLGSLRVLPLPDADIVHPTMVLDESDQPLAAWTLRGSRAQDVPLRQIPTALQQAVIAVEDRQFYRHHAFNLSSVARAMETDILHRKVVQGGSTITQQLAKNLYLNQSRTVSRKVREALYSLQLELHESKDHILEEYLNIVYFGKGAYGVQAAAKCYFGKPVQELNLAECAFLAGLPRGPELYNPALHFKAAKARQHTVLTSMVKSGFLSREDAEAAFAEPLKFVKDQESPQRAPYFTTTAIREVKSQFHLTTDDLDRGNVAIHTTLDSVLQKAAERAVATTIPRGSHLQAALVAMDPQTGAIKAMVGGTNFRLSPYNRTFAERQPGSTFKGILYTAALSQGWSPAKEIRSEMTTFLYDEDKVYTVHDYGEQYAHRPLTLREAIRRSDNVYAVTTNLDVGPDKVVKTARQLGIITPLEPYPALALGVFPTSPLQLATAYSALANGGLTIEPHTVKQISSPTFSQAKEPQLHHERVASPQVAFQMSDLLSSVTEPGGTANRARPYLHGKVAAKTGTTNSDAWVVGYTPQLVCAVWVGYDDNRPLSLQESHLAVPLWGKFMGTAQQRLPGQWFKAPAGLVKRTIDPATGDLATSACADTETDYFITGTEPTHYCPLHPALETEKESHWFLLLPGLFHTTN